MTTRLLIAALALLQPLWYFVLAAPAVLPPAVATGVMLVPILPALVLAAINHRAAGFWGGLAALFYFSHGVMEAWSNPQAALPAWIEIALSVALVFSASWPGLRARAAKRGAPADEAHSSEPRDGGPQ